MRFFLSIYCWKARNILNIKKNGVEIVYFLKINYGVSICSRICGPFASCACGLNPLKGDFYLPVALNAFSPTYLCIPF